MRRGPSSLLLLVLALCAGACDDDDERYPRLIPELPAPPPVPAEALTPLEGDFNVRISDLHAVVGIGVDFDLPFVEATVPSVVVYGPEPGTPDIPIRTLRLVRPDVTFPIDTVITGLDFFIEILGPRLQIDRLIVEDGRVGTLAAPWQAPGCWLWRMRGIDLVAVDVRLGGEAGEPEGFEILRSSAVGEVRSRPITIRDLALNVERNTDFLADAMVRLPGSLVDADFRADRANDWVVTLAADTFAFEDLVALIPQLQEAAPGGGEGVVTLAGGPDLQAADVHRLRLESGRSVTVVRGTVVAEGPEPRFDDVLVEAAPVRAEDVERVFGIAIPGGGIWTGWLTGDGTFREGVRLRGKLAQVRDAGERSDFTVEGVAILEPDATVDLAVLTRPLRAADTAFDASLHLVGPADSLSITAVATMRGVERLTARADALLLDRAGARPVLAGRATVTAAPRTVRRLAGFEPTAEPAPPAPDLVAEAEGSAVLAENGALDVAVTADSLPLTLLPLPEGVDSVRGTVTGRARFGGTVDEPTVRGRFTLDDGAFFAAPLSLHVEAIAAELHLTDGLLVVDTLGARSGGGTLDVTGAVRLFDGPRHFDLEIVADSMTFKDDDEGDLTASADLALEGPFERPRLSGRVYDLHGWIREEAFREAPVLDLDDPPYADLARRVPWPENSRLLARAEPEEPPPIDVDVVIEIDTMFSVIDEDSELFGTGDVVILTGEEDFEAHGVVEIQGGFYAFFGNRFTVRGGSATFEGDVEPFITLKAEYEDDWVIGSGRIPTATAAQRFPPLEFFAFGPAARPNETLSRLSLLPESEEELGELLIFGIEPQPVRGWRRAVVWRPSDPAELTDERAETQEATLLWSYIADEAYDYLPLELGWLQAGTILIEPTYPAPIVVGPMLGAGAILGRFEVFVTQALDGDLIPGVRVRVRNLAPLGAKLEAFSIPRFYADTPLGGDDDGFFVRRKTGVGLFWEWEFGEGGRGINRQASHGSRPSR